MSNFGRNIEVKKERKEKDKILKETIAKYFLDLSKLIFTAIVLGGFVPLFTDEYVSINWEIVISGTVSTIFMALLGYRILKQK